MTYRSNPYIPAGSEFKINDISSNDNAYSNILTEGSGETVNGYFYLPEELGESSMLTINGQLVLREGNPKNLSQTITTDFGELVITGYAMDGKVSYRYIDNGQAKDHSGKHEIGELADNFSLVYKKYEHFVDDANLAIAIKDTDPEAVSQVANIDSDAQDVGGNVLVGGKINVDGMKNVSFENNSNGEIQGKYGKVIFDPTTGSWNYHLDHDNVAIKSLAYQDTLEEVFSYAINDNDGDAANSSLTITITGVDNDPTSAPTVKILAGCDHSLSDVEIAAGVRAVIGIPVEALVGDKLSVDTNNDGQTDFNVILTQQDLDNASITVDIPAEHVPAAGDVIVTATVTDMAGNVSEPGSDSANVLIDMAPIFLNHLGAHLNSKFGPTSKCGTDYNYDGYKTTEMNDNIYIGYRNTALKWSWGDGDFERDCCWDSPWVMDTGAGNDNIYVRGGIKDDVTLRAGTGDDYLHVGGYIMGNAYVDMGDCNDFVNVQHSIVGHATIDMGNGNDTLFTKGYINGYAMINMGSGNDTVIVKNDIQCHADISLSHGDNNLEARNISGSSVITARDGDDTVRVNGSIYDNVKMDLGNGENMLTVEGSIHGRSFVALGGGNDGVIVGHDIDDCAVVYMGGGDDNIYVNGSIQNYASISMEAGNDTLTVRNNIEHQTNIKMGEGDDRLIVANLTDNAKVDMGTGNDLVVIEKSFGGDALVKLGDGNDVLEFQGKAFDGNVEGGAGMDTIVLNYTKDSSLVNTWCNDTNLSSADFTGIEIIQMKGMNAVDIRFSDLVKDTTKESPLFIQGDSNSKVDLGANNWNSDNSSQANLRDGDNWWSSESWQNKGSQTIDNITYDIYHHSTAIDDSNDVFIQQGVVVV